MRRLSPAYRAIVRDYGVAHHRGPSIADALMRLRGGGRARLPARAALLIGGGYNGLVSWSKVLRPMGITVHPRSQYSTASANLAPYDLVVLAPRGASRSCPPRSWPYGPTSRQAGRSW